MTFKQNPFSGRFGNRVEKIVTKSNKSFFLPLNIRFDSRSIKVSPVELKKAQSIWRVSSNLKQKMSFRNFSIKQSTFHVPEVLGTDNARHWSKIGSPGESTRHPEKAGILWFFFGCRNVPSNKNLLHGFPQDVAVTSSTTDAPLVIQFRFRRWRRRVRKTLMFIYVWNLLFHDRIICCHCHRFRSRWSH